MPAIFSPNSCERSFSAADKRDRAAACNVSRKGKLHNGIAIYGNFVRESLTLEFQGR